jgi:hypothetical protein
VTIGNEGMVGVNLALGLDWNPLNAVAMVSGEALRVPTAAFMEIRQESEELEKLRTRVKMNCVTFRRTDFLIRPVFGDGLGNPSYKYS